MDLFGQYSDIKYPKVNYIGNKEKIASWIVDNFPIESGSVLDIFSGGNSISFELKKRNFQVFSNDILYSSFVLSKALIENKETQLDISHIYKALELEVPTSIRQQYSFLDNRLYFASEVDELVKLIVYSEELNEYEKYIFQSLIRRSMIRKLPYSRMNVNWDNIVKLRNEEYSYKKYGRKRAYHNESFSNHMEKNIKSYNSAIFDNGKLNIAYQEDALDMLDNINFVDILYLDPPYPSTMNKYDDFYGFFDKIFNKEKDHMDLTDKKIFLNSIEQLIQKAVNKTNYIIISLNSNSKPDINEIIDILKNYGDVGVKERKHNYQISGKITKNNNFEQLAILHVNKF